MALMIPDSIRSDASQGEKTLYGVLRDRLSNEFLVWYEPEIKGFYPDFVVLSPSFGLLILEVKGWLRHSIVRANKDLFEIKRKEGGIDRTAAEKSPLKQGHGYFGTVSDLLVKHAVLQQPDGTYRGNLAFPIGVGAIMSNITETQAKADGLYPVLEKPQVAYRDELLDWSNFSETDLIERLRGMFKVYFPFRALTPDQISTIKGVLYPEMSIRTVPAIDRSVPRGQKLPLGSSVLLSLDVEQEKLARTMRDGHRLLSGVAGSGKTIILLSRAKAIANRLTEHRILILCFNITLASHLRSILHTDEQNPQYKARIEVRHFHDWARSLLGELPNYGEFEDSEEYNEFMGDRMLAILNQRDVGEKWDSVLVDEAHTFLPKWFLCCVAALKDSVNGDLMIVSDGSQRLYARPDFTWKSVGIQAKGRSRRLAQNYRNTQEILIAAWGVVRSAQAAQPDAEDDITFPVVEPSAALRQGTKPVLHLMRSKAQAITALVEQVRSLRESGYAPAEIAILYRYKSRSDEGLFQGMLAQLQAIGIDTYWITQDDTTKRGYNVKTSGVRVVTALSSLGLEFKAVLLLWVEQFDECCSGGVEQAALARRQLYVAMTRAQDELHLFGSGSGAVLGELEASQGFEVRREAARELVSLPVLKRR